MRLVFAGTPAAALPSLRAVLASRHELLAVITRPDAPAGRGRRLTLSRVAQLAAEAGVEVLRPPRASDPDLLARLRLLAPDCAPVVAYGALVPPALLAVPEHGWVNLHFSLLPAWRGAAPVQHALMAGDDVTGAVTFRLEQGLDTGPVYGAVTETIGPRDTSGDLLERLAVSGAGLLVRTLDGIEDGELVPVPQPADGVSFAPKITVEDARVDWTAPALRVDRLVRGCTPEPGAWTQLGGVRLRLGPVRLSPPDRSAQARTRIDHAIQDRSPQDLPPQDRSPSDAALAPGELAVDRTGVRVGTGSDPVLLGEVRPAGSRAMPAVEWARGARLPADARFT